MRKNRLGVFDKSGGPIVLFQIVNMPSMKITTKLGFIFADAAAERPTARQPIGANEDPNAARLTFLKKVLRSIAKAPFYCRLSIEHTPFNARCTTWKLPCAAQNPHWRLDEREL